LQTASENGNYVVVEQLLKQKNINVNGTSIQMIYERYSFSSFVAPPLALAIASNSAPTVKLLLDYMYEHEINIADIINKEYLHRHTLLLSALTICNPDVIHILLNRKYSNILELINYTNSSGQTPLMFVLLHHDILSNNIIKCIEILISNGANINEIDDNGNTILFRIVRNLKTNKIKILLDKKADPNIPNLLGMTVIDYIKHFEMVNYYKLFNIVSPIVQAFENNDFLKVFELANINVINCNFSDNDTLEDCGFCYENKVNVKMHCNHRYCMKCFADYYCIKKISNRCGFCRKQITSNINVYEIK